MLLSAPSAKAGGRDAVGAAEFIREVIRIVEAAGVSDLAYRSSGLVAKHILCLLKPYEREIFGEAEARFLLEGAREVLGAYRIELRHHRKGDVGHIVLLYVLDGLLDEETARAYL